MKCIKKLFIHFDDSITFEIITPKTLSSIFLLKVTDTWNVSRDIGISLEVNILKREPPSAHLLAISYVIIIYF